jgi:hypothetical protein
VPAAQNAQEVYQVPASVTIAQAILESGWGTSTLASNDNNFFGIKCTDANSPGSIAVACHAYPTTECTPDCHTENAYFRVYRSKDDSFADHGNLLRNSGIYDSAFAHIEDPNGFVTEIANDGYATDPNYAKSVVSLMQSYNLYAYDIPYIGVSSVQTGSMYRVFARGSDDQLWQAWFDSSWHWQPVGGLITSGPSASYGSDGVLRVFARGQDGALWQAWWDGSSWQWQSLGGLIVGAPSATTTFDGVLRVFARGNDGQLWQDYWDGSSWHWQAIGGLIASGPGAFTSADGTLRVFARGNDGALWQAWWDGSSWQWQSIGGLITSAPSVMYAFSDPTLRVFARGNDGALWQAWWDGSSWQWQSLGGAISGGPGAITGSDQVLHVFARGNDGQLWQDYWDGSTWHWQPDGGALR